MMSPFFSSSNGGAVASEESEKASIAARRMGFGNGCMLIKVALLTGWG
jgi:hypothetical protein